MSGSRVVVLGGYAKSGKDAVADILVKDFGWYKTYMSKPLEKALLTLDPYVPWHAPDASGYWTRYSEMHARIGYDESKNNKEVRRLLQAMGTEVGRELFGPAVWLNNVLRETYEQLDVDKKVVVTGIRYPNEMDAFKTLGATSIWVSRPGYGPVNSHSSDNTLGPNDFTKLIDNDGTLDDLKTRVVLTLNS